jgi:hypothetical protein
MLTEQNLRWSHSFPSKDNTAKSGEIWRNPETTEACVKTTKTNLGGPEVKRFRVDKKATSGEFLEKYVFCRIKPLLSETYDVDGVR